MESHQALHLSFSCCEEDRVRPVEAPGGKGFLELVVSNHHALPFVEKNSLT